MTAVDKIFPKAVRTRGTSITLAAAFAQVIVFDLIWCYFTSFSAMSKPELYLNALVLSLFAAAPYALFRCRPVQIAVFIIIDIWLIANLMYSRTYVNAIPLQSYTLIGNLSDFTDSAADQFRWIDLLIIAITATYSVLIYRSKPEPGIKTTHKALYMGYFAIAAIISSSISLIVGDGSFCRRYERWSNAHDYVARVPVFTLAGKLYYDYAHQHKDISAEELQFLQTWDGQRPQLQPVAGKKPQSVVIILCESLESWVIGNTVEGTELTPNLNALIADSATLYAPHVLSQVGDGRSIDAQLLILSGLRPLISGAWAISEPDTHYPSLPKAIKAADGTRNYILTVDKDVTWNQRSVAAALGIDTLLWRRDWVIDEKVSARKRLSDGSLMRQSADKMRHGEIWPEGEKAFVMIVTSSGHNPYVLPEELKRVKFSDNIPERLADYMTAANYTDYAIGQLIDYLRTRSDFNDTMIVVTGDHEGLSCDRNVIGDNEYGKYGQYVPLLIAHSPVGGRVDGTIGQVDIYPTLLALLGLESYAWPGAGRCAIDSDFTAFAIGNDRSIDGDTTGAGIATFEYVLNARKASDLLIRHDRLPR